MLAVCKEKKMLRINDLEERVIDSLSVKCFLFSDGF